MKIAVIGASGFIGSRFVELYKDEFDIVKLNSKNAPLHNFNILKEKTENVDILVHAAFDHSYKDNIIGIKNILKVCEENNIKKLVYLSTISVYDPDIEGVLTENSPYSNLNDPYSKEKRKIEKIIDNFDKTFDVVILQPSIVFGLGGNWTKYALYICKSKTIKLPNKGKDICNAIYVDDVANAIYQSCINNIKYDKILISSDIINWEIFYCKQCEILKKLNLPSNCNIENNSSQNEFHSNGLINFIFILWFKTSLGNILDMMIGTLKSIRARSYKDTSSKEALKRFLQSGISQNILEPFGITKKVHSCKFKVDITKAKEILKYEPKYNFEKAIEDIRQEIQEVLK